MAKNIKLPSNKSFGLVFFILFLIIGIWPLLNDTGVRIWSLVISLIFLVLGLMSSKILYPLNFIWFKFGLLLGSIVAPLVLGVIFFFVVTPTGIIMKLLGKDLLKLKKNKKNSYWIIRDKKSSTSSSMKNQF